MTLRRKKKATLIVCHDAGGAELIAAFIRASRERMRSSVIYAGGPARRVFRREHISSKPEPRKTELKKIMARHRGATALLGTSWAHSIEFAALREAKAQNIKTIAYLDSWSNYRERFGYPAWGWRRNLPDEIWAGDAAAFALAKRYFTHVTVRFMPNQYFSSITKRYRALARLLPKPESVLFMSAAGPLSEKFLANFLKAYVGHQLPYIVRVRAHPRDNKARYRRIIRRYKGVAIELSNEKDIVQDFVRGRIVVGPETVALVPAVKIGIKVIRIVPKGEKPFLPFSSMTRVKTAEAAVRLISRKIGVA